MKRTVLPALLAFLSINAIAQPEPMEKEQLPVIHYTSDKMVYLTDADEIRLSGHVSFTTAELTIHAADSLTYNQSTGELAAFGVDRFETTGTIDVLEAHHGYKVLRHRLGESKVFIR